MYLRLPAFIVLEIRRLSLTCKPQYFVKRMPGINGARASANRTFPHYLGSDGLLQPAPCGIGSKAHTNGVGQSVCRLPILIPYLPHSISRFLCLRLITLIDLMDTLRSLPLQHIAMLART